MVEVTDSTIAKKNMRVKVREKRLDLKLKLKTVGVVWWGWWGGGNNARIRLGFMEAQKRTCDRWC